MDLQVRTARTRRGWWLVALTITSALAIVIALLVPTEGRSEALTAGGFSTVASVSRAKIAPGATASISVTVTNVQAVAASALVDVEVYDAAGVKVFQVYHDNQAFPAGGTHVYHAAWTVPTNQPGGRYTVKVGVFPPGWGSVLQWNANAASFTVTSPAPTTTSSTTPTTLGTTTTTNVVPSPAPALPALPAGWPASLQLGVADQPSGAAALRASGNFAFRYQYLAGGVNTGQGWATWNPGGQFVTNYVQESKDSGFIPVFTYYQLLQSAPGNSQPEPASDFANLANPSTMSAYFQDATLFFQRAATSSPVVLQVEPDLWGHMEEAAHNDDAATVPVQVSATGNPDLAGLPNNAAGLAQAFVRLRDRYAPNVILGYSFSGWGTGTDILFSKPSDDVVTALGTRTANFYNSLSAKFDIAFTDFTDGDRDAAYKQLVNGDGGASWYSADDYRRSALYLSAFVQTARTRVVLWQIPLGNTVMRADNNTWDHYQDNKVQWLLDDPSGTHLAAFADAGVVAFLFGRGADGNTCSCDAAGDGITNPAPIDGNTASSVSADDDGGFFHQQAKAYLSAPLPLPHG